MSATVTVPATVRSTPGSAFPLGATLLPGGTNFAVASDVAVGMILCLFDADGTEHQVPLVDNDAGVWHAFVPGVVAGTPYGFRAGGPWDPSRGLRCNPAKLLLDPYARAISGDVQFGPEVLGYVVGDADAPSALDSAHHMPRSIVVDQGFDWEGDVHPGTDYADTVFYEAHLKGLTALHPDVPAELRGTYAGLGHPAVIQHLLDLGVTAVELLPVHHSVPEAFLVESGRTNYWGYNTIGYLAPHEKYSAHARAGLVGGQVDEFKTMVKRLHAAGLEVILDVVFNHTAEGGSGGPTLCHRGIDNPSYYRLSPTDPRSYYDTTGTGNSLNVDHATTLRLIMDSLRYWILEMHVDGFRFDLATTLAREDGSFEKTASFFDLITQDPVVGRTKLIAEPWDVGQLDSYSLGRFPPLWSEWNGRYRDSVRDFWRGTDGMLAELATRLAGSSDLFGGSVRRPSASVNLVTVHDGFTLRDLVSYDEKHNEANGEQNRDGSTDNRSWNSGAEGPTDEPAVIALRGLRTRAILTTLLTSLGAPLLLGGDELGRTQLGNNNAYCQDGPITWVDWENADQELLTFTRRLIGLRRRHPVLRRRRFLTGAQTEEIGWYSPTGQFMASADWADPRARSVAMYLDGSDAPDRDDAGQPIIDTDLLLLVNGWSGAVEFTVPDARPGNVWTVALDSSVPTGESTDVTPRGAGDQVWVPGWSVLVLTSPPPGV
ncbi:glycogen debranching protein GlgX [Cellulomonas sp. URHD0024]|uniref:glycogen debranching protein GlgX n=1 Tax=Cellulomonas sp. URHD0024 TaxID=1302620 RepID=UPI0003FFABE0|nr:glycogen debranching protein GlgX [Cellulomonas sp. URHD0024]